MSVISRVRRRLCIALGLLGCLLIAGCAAWLLSPRTAITQENAARIPAGMTLAEVEAILGGAGRDESTGLLFLDSRGMSRDELDALAAHRAMCLISSQMAAHNGK